MFRVHKKLGIPIKSKKEEKKTKEQVSSSSTSGIDIPYLKGKSIEQVKGILTQQLGPLQEVLPLANPEEEIDVMKMEKYHFMKELFIVSKSYSPTRCDEVKL